MRIAYKAPGNPAKVMEVPNELHTLQELVGGYIETVPGPASDCVYIVNEEGLLRSLWPCIRYGAQWLRGPVLCVKTKGDSFVTMRPGEAASMAKLMDDLGREALR